MLIKWTDLIVGDKIRLSKEYCELNQKGKESWMNAYTDLKNRKSFSIKQITLRKIDCYYNNVEFLEILLDYSYLRFHIDPISGECMGKSNKFPLFEVVELI